MAFWNLSENKSSGGFYELSVLGLCNEAEISAIRHHPRTETVFLNTHGANRLKVLIWADSYEEAAYVRDWMQEETLRPDEPIVYDWSDYLDSLV